MPCDQAIDHLLRHAVDQLKQQSSEQKLKLLSHQSNTFAQTVCTGLIAISPAQRCDMTPNAYFIDCRLTLASKEMLTLLSVPDRIS